MQQITKVLEVISSMSSTLALDEILAEFTEKTTQILGADGCAISQWNREDDTVVVLADYVSPQVELPFNDIKDVGAAYPLAHYPATAKVLHEQSPLIVYADDPAADQAEKELLQAFQWAGVLMIPMLHKGQAIGLLELYTDDKHRYQFSNNDITLCQILANQAAIALENARLYQETEDGRLHAEAIQVISRALTSELDYQRIVRNVADFAYRLVGAQLVCVAVPQTSGFRPIIIVGRDQSDAAILHFVNVSLSLPNLSPLGQTIRGPVVIPDIQRDSSLASLHEEAQAQGWQTMAVIPLLSHNQVLGVLAAYAYKPNFFAPDDVAILMSLASQAAVAIQNAQLFAELEAQRAALQKVSLRLVNAQEEERRRISRELHDELGQGLTALKINLDVARRSLPENAPLKLSQSVNEASTLAVKTLETARTLSLELRPALLDDLGLVAALRWEIDRYEQRTGQAVHFEAELGEIALQPELEITIYRIIIEALTNVARHAQASHITVHLQVKNRQLRASITDDGLGFNARAWFNSPTRRHSLGLVSMRERAELLGGQLEVISEPGSGTKVQAQLPIDNRYRR